MAIPNSAAEAAEVLGVAPGADAEAVRKRYRELAMRFHPDLNPDDPQADQRMAELNRARDLLADGVPLDVRRQVKRQSAPPQPRRPQSPAERAETHRAFRDEMERARRTDAERAQRRRAARRRERRAAEQRAQRAAEESRRPPPETRSGEREDRRRAAGANSARSTRSTRRRSAAEQQRRAKPHRAPESGSVPPIDRIAAALDARGWVDAAAALRERYRGNGGVAPASVEIVLSVTLDGARFDAALVVAAPGTALAAPLLDQAMQRAVEEEVPLAFAMNERMFRQAVLRQRTRTNPTTMERFPSPDELRAALVEHFAEVETEGAESGRDWGPANFGRLFR